MTKSSKLITRKRSPLFHPAHYRILLLKLIQKINLPEDFYMLFLAGIIGTLAGLGAYLLHLLVNLVHHLLFVRFEGMVIGTDLGSWVRALFPAVGGLAVGLVIYYFAREVKGHGVPSVIEAVANRGGYIRPRVSIITAITAGTTIGSGGSAGKEGPIVQIGAAIGSTIGQLFSVSSERLKVLVATGAGAGLAAVFNAPVTGVLFALEVILADFSLNAFSPIIFATVISTTISHHLIGSSPVLNIPIYYLESAYEYPIYFLMGIVGAVVSVSFTNFLYSVEEFFAHVRRLPEFLKPATGGLLVGLLALYFPEIYGFDDGAIHRALLAHTGIGALFLLMVVKIVATAFSLGSGGTGGLFTPSLFIGAAFGAFFGSVANTLFPTITAPPGAYALVGMGILIAGTTHATLSALLLIFEITSNYQIILPLMLGTIVATITSRLLMKENIYTKAISLSGDYIFKGRNLTLLQSIPIRQHIQREFETIPENMRFKDILKLMKNSTRSTFPVVNTRNHLVGIISLRDIRPYLFDEHLYPLLIAKDVAREDYFSLTPDQSLADVLRMFDLTDAEMLPVTSRRNPRKLLGVIFRDDLMRWYRKAPLLQKRKGYK